MRGKENGSGEERDRFSCARGNPKFLPSKTSLPNMKPSCSTTKPQPHLHSSQSKEEFFAGPMNTEANRSFLVRLQLQRTLVFRSLHNGVAISYFEQTKPQPKALGLGRFKAAGPILHAARRAMEAALLLP